MSASAGNDIGWTLADDSGNTGYGCRCYGQLNGLRFVRNRVHDIAADGFQGVNGRNVVIDRNEIGPVGANPGSSEHSDLIQIVSNGITPGSPTTGSTTGLLQRAGGQQRRLYLHPRRVEGLAALSEQPDLEQPGPHRICGLGTGGNSRSNLIIRRNTWVTAAWPIPASRA